MATSTVVVFPPNVLVKTVTVAVGAIAGMPTRLDPLRDGSSVVARNDAVYETTPVPEMLYIKFDGRYCHYHFEGESRIGPELSSGSATPFWAVVGRRLVEFFGGHVVYNDSESAGFDLSVPFRSVEENAANSGEAWNDLQHRLAAIEPISRDELLAMKEIMKADRYGEFGDDYPYEFDDNGRMVRGSIVTA